MGGGGIFSAALAAALPRRVLFLELTRFSISTLASVVSLGSPGSRPLSTLSEEAFRCRLLGGFCEALVDSGAVVSPSSAEASRDSVCWSEGTAGVSTSTVWD